MDASGSYLSKNLLSMKFMRRRADAEERVRAQSAVDEQIASAHWTVPGTERAVRLCILDEAEPEPGFTRGRISFGNFNPEVEKRQKERRHDQKRIKRKIAEKQVTADALAAASIISSQQPAKRSKSSFVEAGLDSAQPLSRKRKQSSEHLPRKQASTG
eukprot:TRINITY_DN3075_c0_g1_i1.p1 TRINITY_DN3075_c0_g1~~TRINITY_DN3075_c0_g1_i1.p1  ORF type:complete len:165 (+),score=14.77 TRINITY_DN3075_c0_g1_i1:22-495(+)